MADLRNLEMVTDSSTTFRLELVNPITLMPLEDEKGKAWIEVLSPQSDAYQKAQKAYQNQRINARKAGTTIDDVNREMSDVIAKCIVAWNNIEMDGQPLECDYANAFMILSDRRFAWLRKQVDDYIGNEGNFIKR